MHAHGWVVENLHGGQETNVYQIGRDIELMLLVSTSLYDLADDGLILLRFQRHADTANSY